MNGIEFHMKWCGLIDEVMLAFFVECEERGLHPLGAQSRHLDHEHLNVRLHVTEFFSDQAKHAARKAFPSEMADDWLELRRAMFNNTAKRRRRSAAN